MQLKNGFAQSLLVLAFLLPGSAAWADWELESDKSVVNFVSIKNNSVAEVHSFTSLVGYIGEAGNAQLTISLDSVKTLIDVRDQRMRDMLFEVVKFPSATISADIDPAVLAVAAGGGIVTADVPVTLSLHGHEQKLTIPAVVVGEGDGKLRVFTARPVTINAADFGLEAGVEALREVAGLQAISNAVPVTLQLHFRSAD